ncbi:hypothetical protein D3C72_2346460 [compost metagenome]
MAIGQIQKSATHRDIACSSACASCTHRMAVAMARRLSPWIHSVLARMAKAVVRASGWNALTWLRRIASSASAAASACILAWANAPQK